MLKFLNDNKLMNTFLIVSGPTKKRTASSSSSPSVGQNRKTSTTLSTNKAPQSSTKNQNQNQIPESADSVDHNQPDVIKAASEANKKPTKDLVIAVSKDIANLQQENEQLDCQLRRHALGFDAMATLVDYLANHCGVVGVMASNSQLKQDMTSLQQSLEDKKQEIGKCTCKIKNGLIKSKQKYF